MTRQRQRAVSCARVNTATECDRQGVLTSGLSCTSSGSDLCRFAVVRQRARVSVYSVQVRPLSGSSEFDPRIIKEMHVEYRQGESAYTPAEFVALALRVWPRDYDLAKAATALQRTINIGAWIDDRLVGSVRVLSDGYLFNTVPEVMVDPDYQRRGIGRELMRQALDSAPGGRLFFGAQPGNEEFFERSGFVRGPVGFVGRRPQTVQGDAV
jgi:GNAT superfamily N-acetyltransferase